jgi:hypothetical protein
MIPVADVIMYHSCNSYIFLEDIATIAATQEVSQAHTMDYLPLHAFGFHPPLGAE